MKKQRSVLFGRRKRQKGNVRKKELNVKVCGRGLGKGCARRGRARRGRARQAWLLTTMHTVHFPDIYSAEMVIF